MTETIYYFPNICAVSLSSHVNTQSLPTILLFHIDGNLLTATFFKNFHFKNWLKYMNTKSTNKFNQENTISSSNIKHWGIQWDLVFLHPPY